ncbi:MAG: helix-turn-helix domain-containing protein [Alteromonadaceae bacterium]|nr:helix-turn-helix domain-containing protein [Alteromonadaceae bacterium]
MSVSIFSRPVDVRHIDFSRNKYGSPLLVDVAWIREMPSFAHTVEPYSLDFYDITFITRGQGSFWLDEQEYQLAPNQVLFTTPGQIRRWYVSGLEGICLFFPAEFMLEHFNDPLLLHRMHYFHTHAGPRNLILSSEQATTLIERLSAMHGEIQELREDSSELLRSICHEVMTRLNRWYTDEYKLLIEKPLHVIVSKFKKCVDKHFHQYHKVQEYADLLAVTPGHLNFMCRQHLGRSASQIIQDRVFCEASRRLVHSQIPIDALSDALGFTNTTYFCRAFKRKLGLSPLQYRKQAILRETL